MKKYFICILLITLVGCRSYHINIDDDSYLNKSTISMEMHHKSYDWRYGQVWSGKYSREIMQNKLRPVVNCIELRCNNVTAELSRDAFMQIDSEKFGLTIRDQKEVVEHVISKEMWDSGSSRIITICLVIDSNLEKKILNASAIQYRLYIDKNPVTLFVSGYQLGKIKEFIDTK